MAVNIKNIKMGVVKSYKINSNASEFFSFDYFWYLKVNFFKYKIIKIVAYNRKNNTWLNNIQQFYIIIIIVIFERFCYNIFKASYR